MSSVRKRIVDKSSSEPPAPTIAETFARAFTSEAKWTDKVCHVIFRLLCYIYVSLVLIEFHCTLSIDNMLSFLSLI